MSYEIIPPQQGDEWVPPRFKPSNVDRFVPVLKDVLLEKREIRFKHESIGLNANTAMHRINDAVLAVVRGKVFYPDIDSDKLREVWLLYRVKYDHLTREVVVYKYKEQPTAVIDNVYDITVRVKEPFFEEYLTHLAWIYGYGKFRGSVTILGILDESLKERLKNSFNIVFRQDKPNEHIMT